MRRNVKFVKDNSAEGGRSSRVALKDDSAPSDKTQKQLAVRLARRFVVRTATNRMSRGRVRPGDRAYPGGVPIIFHTEALMECIIQTVMFRPFTGHDVAVSIVIAVLLGCSALVSGSETAFFSLTPRNIAQLKTGRSRSGRAILKLLSVQEYLLATILIVNNLVNICIVILSNGLIDSLTDFGGAAGLEFVVKTVVVTFLLLLFGEIMPKIFASYNPLRVARMTSIPLLLLKSVFRPLAYVLIRSGSYINESVAKKRVNISIDELSNAHRDDHRQTVEEDGCCPASSVSCIPKSSRS